MTDIFQTIDAATPQVREMVATRLEARAHMPLFRDIREAYLDRVGVPSSGRIIEIGCGTGPVCRAIASRPGFAGNIVGTDLSAHLIETARRLTDPAAFPNISYRQADARGGHMDGGFDMVLAHTVISHVADPLALVGEAIRLARPGGRIVIHDGDYASLVLHTGAADLDRKMSRVILQAVVANRHVMRELPDLLSRLEVTVRDVSGDVVTGVSDADYFVGLAKTYGPVAAGAGLLKEPELADWLERMDRAVSEHRFFGSCNFVTYSLVRPA